MIGLQTRPVWKHNEHCVRNAHGLHTHCRRSMCKTGVRCVRLEADRSLCVIKYGTARAIRERTSPYAFSRRTLMSYTNPSSSRTHLFTLACHVTECNRSLCGWKIAFFISRYYRKCNYSFSPSVYRFIYPGGDLNLNTHRLMGTRIKVGT